MNRVQTFARCMAVLAFVAGLEAIAPAAVTTNWNTNSNGVFTNPANWTNPANGENVAPGAADTAVFNRGSAVSLTASFLGSPLGIPAPVYTTSRLIVRSNSVSFARGTGTNGPSYVAGETSLDPSGRAIIVGQQNGDVATLTTSIPVSATAATIADVTGSTGELHVTSHSTFTLTGDAPSPDQNAELLVGNHGVGTLDIDNGGQLKLTGPDGRIDVAATAGSFGSINVDGAGSNLTNAGTFFNIGEIGTGFLTITGGGQVNDVVAFVAFPPGSAGSVTVDGVGSLWNSTGSADIGVAGPGDSKQGMLEVVNGGAAAVTGQLVIGTQGTVLGNGTVTAGSVINYGVFSPRAAPAAPLGALHVTSDITQNTSSHLQIQIGGTTAGTQYDQLLVTGTVHLAGALDVSLFGGFTPASGDSFDVITWTSHTSTFDTVNLPTLPGLLVWDTAQLYTAGILSVILPGDYNHNGVVDAADYTVWRDSLGQTGGGLAADGNDDGGVTQTDYQFWADRFGHHAGSGAGASANSAVPEPASLWMLLAGILTTCVRRRPKVS